MLSITPFHFIGTSTIAIADFFHKIVTSVKVIGICGAFAHYTIKNSINFVAISSTKHQKKKNEWMYIFNRKPFHFPGYCVCPQVRFQLLFITHGALESYGIIRCLHKLFGWLMPELPPIDIHMYGCCQDKIKCQKATKLWTLLFFTLDAAPLPVTSLCGLLVMFYVAKSISTKL